MRTYLEMLDHVLTRGRPVEDRTGVGTLAVTGYQGRYDLADGAFPLVTTKRVHVPSVVAELLWIARGETNVSGLHRHGVTIWDEWAGPGGRLGPVYGHQWRTWPTGRPDVAVDQVATVLRSLTLDPGSRRHVISAWNPADLPAMALPPCHAFVQFHARDGVLDCSMFQRSADVFLGVPFNIASYAALTHLVAGLVGLRPGELVHSIGDLHLYRNHVEQARLQLGRQPRAVPTLTIAGLDRPRLDPALLTGEPVDVGGAWTWVADGQVRRTPVAPSICAVDVLPRLCPDDFAVDGYDPLPAISAQVAV